MHAATVLNGNICLCAADLNTYQVRLLRWHLGQNLLRSLLRLKSLYHLRKEKEHLVIDLPKNIYCWIERIIAKVDTALIVHHDVIIILNYWNTWKRLVSQISVGSYENLVSSRYYMDKYNVLWLMDALRLW